MVGAESTVNLETHQIRVHDGSVKGSFARGSLKIKDVRAAGRSSHLAVRVRKAEGGERRATCVGARRVLAESFDGSQGTAVVPAEGHPSHGRQCLAMRGWDTLGAGTARLWRTAESVARSCLAYYP
jgi:hypothetical protein